MEFTNEMDNFILDLTDFEELPMIESPVYVAVGNHYVIICG